jgi:hypothetical protein
MVIKKKRIMFFIILAFLITFLFVSGVSFAYLQTQGNTGASQSTKVNVGTTDKLTFSYDKSSFSINATQSTLASGVGNLSDSINAVVKLESSNALETSEQVSYSYIVYLNIKENDFVYTTGSDKTPELILEVSNTGGKSLSISNLTNISGNKYDITTSSGLIKLASTTIEATGPSKTITNTWTVKVTLANLTTSQNENASKTFDAEVIIKQEEVTPNTYTLLAEGLEIVNQDRTITNKLENYGSFENGGWNSNCVISTDYVKYGSQSCKITATASTAEVTSATTSTFSMDTTHMYYARVETYQTTKQGSTDIYWPIAEPRFANGYGNANQWNIVSAVNSRSDSRLSSGNFPLRIDFNNNKVAGVMYFDGVMLIDLTNDFGSSYPSKSVLDSELLYFDGSAGMRSINGVSFAKFKVNTTKNTFVCNSGTTATINNGVVTITSNQSYATCVLK